ncbi:hypothetical protein AN639_10110 [Candidatus Epulonipiscium fishelsonii]|uniref:Uncharacterized protein n=1 Tax=Candidatus Epulonipiscium fishelsonii TaxID=77094 RepID=A0ACC8X861_9FIRM|nr:hypothetical protein AN396_11230 [Epulopiscium sp. SCG-B11WGA-EpuloA1]ONI43675.1 hypothetical protein AN639_10110 [Epulopiscium sp. SCG-B05WGA-EpuloA1]
MKHFITVKLSKDNQRKYTVASFIVWILIWEISAKKIGEPIFLPSPILVFNSLLELSTTKEFYQSIIFSFCNISFGCIIGILFGILLAILAHKNVIIEYMFRPLMIIIKSIPVVSFIILILLWVSSNSLSVLISFLMVVPIIYTNVLIGIKSTNVKLIEMTKVFNVSKLHVIKYIYIFEVYPFFKSAVSVALGLSFKSGIAAELIGLPKNSIGENLYNAKIYLETANLFAWSIVIILLCIMFEKVFLIIINKLIKGLKR